jgi:hypothetical protein
MWQQGVLIMKKAVLASFLGTLTYLLVQGFRDALSLGHGLGCLLVKPQMRLCLDQAHQVFNIQVRIKLRALRVVDGASPFLIYKVVEVRRDISREPERNILRRGGLAREEARHLELRLGDTSLCHLAASVMSIPGS